MDMKRKTNLITEIALIVVSLALSAASVSAQTSLGSQSATKTNSRILYHNGPVRTGTQNAYFIFYGCWTNTCGILGDTASVNILTEFVATVGNTPYLTINSTYADGSGHPASSAVVFAGMVMDSSYAHGVELT